MAGQIIKRGENNYLVRIYLGKDANGKRQYHNKTIRGNKKDAERYRTRVLRERDTGTFIEPAKEPLADYLDNWAEKVLKMRVRQKTYLDYRSRLDLYVKPNLGDMPLSKITPDQVQAVYNSMMERGLSSRTIRYTHTILRNAFQQAVKWGKLYRNPADLVDLPRQEKEEMKVLTPEEAGRFVDAIVYSKWKPLFSLMIATGVRPSEALALKWQDINLEKKRITINRSITRPKPGSSQWNLQETKTTRSRRTIPIPDSVVEDLKEHKKKQNNEIVRAKPGTYTNYGFVFAAENGEPAMENNIRRRHFKPLLKEAGLPDIRLYDLRHTCATLLLSAGENPKVVSERLGHASTTLTLDTYSHVLPDMQEKATEKLQGILFEREENESKKNERDDA